MKQRVIICTALALLIPAAWAGVVVEMEVKASDSAGTPGTDTIYAQGEMARMDTDSENMSMIFRDYTLCFV
jgi:hypothetical protein